MGHMLNIRRVENTGLFLRLIACVACFVMSGCEPWKLAQRPPDESGRDHRWPSTAMTRLMLDGSKRLVVTAVVSEGQTHPLFRVAMHRADESAMDASTKG